MSMFTRPFPVLILTLWRVSGLFTDPQDDTYTPEELAESLIGTGVTISDHNN